MTHLIVAVTAGLLIGLSLGAVGGGGSILAVPVLVFGLDQSAVQATTGSLAVVGVTAVVAAYAARRAGHVRMARGVAFGLAAITGAALVRIASARVPAEVLLASFSALMLVVAALMSIRLVRGRGTATGPDGRALVTLRPFTCDCPQVLRVFLTATVVGLLTGFLGVGGGFLVVPALALALAMPMRVATGTSLVVIAITSFAALATRVADSGGGHRPDWVLVAALAGFAVIGSVLGTRVAAHASERALAAGFTALVVLVAVYTAARSLPPLLS